MTVGSNLFMGFIFICFMCAKSATPWQFFWPLFGLFHAPIGRMTVSTDSYVYMYLSKWLRKLSYTLGYGNRNVSSEKFMSIDILIIHLDWMAAEKTNSSRWRKCVPWSQSPHGNRLGVVARLRRKILNFARRVCTFVYIPLLLKYKGLKNSHSLAFSPSFLKNWIVCQSAA